jgi:hypothetical protein
MVDEISSECKQPQFGLHVLSTSDNNTPKPLACNPDNYLPPNKIEADSIDDEEVCLGLFKKIKIFLGLVTLIVASFDAQCVQSLSTSNYKFDDKKKNKITDRRIVKQ